ncbi:MAG TPA: PAS domain-containing protein [Myxococcota bacterium]|nr:PAS domain-containing protein [Myxococcota bacterium]
MRPNSESRYRDVFEGLTLGVVIQDATGAVVAVNAAAEDLLSLPRAALLGRGAASTDWRPLRPDGSPFPIEEQPAFRALREGTVIRGVVMGVYLPAEDRHRWIRIDAVPLSPPGGGAPREVFTVFDDVSHQRADELLLETVLDAIPDVLGVQDTAHRILRYNKAGYDLLGPPEAVDGRRCHELIGHEAPCADCATREAIATGRVARIERESPELDRIYQVSAYPILEEGGRVTRVVEHLRDVTAERRALAERDRMREQLLHAQKLEAIGRLAGGVAHDFNNLLTAIGGFADLLQTELPAGSPGRQDLWEIRRAAERAGELTRQLLAFSRQQVIAPRSLDLNAILGGVERMLRRLLGEDVRVELSLGQELWRVWADAGQVEQVIFNLVTNARDAMPGGGRLRVSTGNVVLDEEAAGRLQGAAPGEWVYLSVADDGVGMEPAVRARLFEPFFTTKPKGVGTGLGLSTVYGIVSQHGGFMDVASSQGSGSEFRAYLPHSTRADEVPAGDRRAPAPARGQELVLLVEDEPQVRELTRRFLEALGYRVHACGDAAAALEALDAEPALQPDLLLTDVVLPGLSGRELADLLQAQRPGLRALLMSGWSEALDATSTRAARGLPLLPKPFDMASLARAVRSALERPTL